MILGGATALLPAFARDILHVGEEGFGILSEIDVRATLKAKLGVDFELRSYDYDPNAASVERFRAAAVGGDLQSLMDVLAPDVVLITDGFPVGDTVSPKTVIERANEAEKQRRLFGAEQGQHGAQDTPAVAEGGELRRCGGRRSGR